MSEPIVAAAVALGGVYNLWFTRRLRRWVGAKGARLALSWELQLHAVADVGALTLLLLACGGLRNPICMFYGFHVVLGAMLGLVRGALLSAGLGGAGVLLLVVCEHFGWLPSAPLLTPPLWLVAAALGLTILSLAYFSLGALRFLRREEDRAVQNSQLLLTGLDALNVGLDLVGADSRILLRNQRAATVHPCPDGCWQPPPGLNGLPTADLRVERQPAAGPYRFAHAESGEARIYEMMALTGSAGGPRAYLYVDRTESTLDEQRALMLERLASLGRAMQAVAHELNTPLATIQTLAVDLSHALTGEDEAESISLLIDEARRCGEITRELLSSAREDQPSLRVRTSLRDVVRRAIRLTYGTKPGQSGVALHGDLNATCVTDSDRLLQILVNLLQNARDASPNTPVEVHLVQTDREAVIEVRDHGPGLPPQVRERLFRPFMTTKPPGKGTGLGLYTCARLAVQLEARLTLDDAPSGGTRACLVLPRLHEEAT